MASYNKTLWNTYTNDNLETEQQKLGDFFYHLSLGLGAKKICEVGTNIGNNLMGFPKQFDVTGIDLNEHALSIAKKKYPELASEFYQIANTLYPYGIISFSKTRKISYEEAEKFFFTNVHNLTNLYIDEMKKNGEKNKSYFKLSFIGDDLRFCHEVTKSFNLVISELNNE